MDLPREAFGSEGSNCFSLVVYTRISQETYSHLLFIKGSGPFVPTLDLPMRRV